MSKQLLDKLVDRFLSWPLPDSVCADKCASIQRYPHRTGTNLLSAVEAGAMIEHLLNTHDCIDDFYSRSWCESRHAEKGEIIQALQGTLREVYALAGEDPQINKIINDALDQYPYP